MGRREGGRDVQPSVAVVPAVTPEVAGRFVVVVAVTTGLVTKEPLLPSMRKKSGNHSPASGAGLIASGDLQSGSKRAEELSDVPSDSPTRM
jgi:hypothetical protein